jgi:hypothetical protein
MVRSFLLVRIVRGGLVLVFLAVALVGVAADHWPAVVAVAVGAAIVAQAAALAANCRRYGRTSRRVAPGR